MLESVGDPARGETPGIAWLLVNYRGYGASEGARDVEIELRCGPRESCLGGCTPELGRAAPGGALASNLYRLLELRDVLGVCLARARGLLPTVGEGRVGESARLPLTSDGRRDCFARDAKVRTGLTSGGLCRGEGELGACAVGQRYECARYERENETTRASRRAIGDGRVHV